MKLWITLVLLRFLLVVIPQTGYVHPDEFFQTAEVVAGGVLNVTVMQPWEFNRAFPIRSIAIPYVTVGLPFALTQTGVGKELFGSPPHPYWLTVLPRLLMAFLSLIQDFCMYRLCFAFKVNYERCLTVFAMSWVCLVLFTRTLGNSLEATIFSILLWKIGMILHSYSKKTIGKDSKKAGKYVAQENFDFDLPGTSAVGVILTLGVFNRPTFACFAIAPLFFWLKLGLQLHLKSILPLLQRLIGLMSTCFLTANLLIAVDTFYYHGITINDLLTGEVSLKELLENVIVTPLNFIKYNLNSSNLEQHGLHPRWLHALVNMPLLYSLLFLYAFCHFSGITQLVSGKGQESQLQRPVKTMMVMGFIVPLLSLSAVPHQEPRFLAPLLFPLVFLYASSLTSTKKINRLLFFLWLLHNLSCSIFFGFLHQGGLLPCMFSLHEKIHSHLPESVNTVDVIFSHTYMPPRFLLAIPKSGRKQAFVHDFGGQGIEVLEAKVKDLMLFHSSSKQVYFVIPASLKSLLSEIAARTKSIMPFKAELIGEFFPHISTEELPSVSDLWSCCKKNLTVCLSDFVDQWKKHKFSLHLYQLHRLQKQT